MIKAVIFSLVAGIGGLWIATKFVPGVTFQGSFQTFLIAGVSLGIIIAIVRPLLNLISFVLRIIILGGVIFILILIAKSIFPEFVVSGFVPLAYSSAVIAGLAIILSLII